MRIVSVLLVVGVAAMAAGCQRTADQMSYTELRGFVSDMNRRCQAQGVKPGTQEMRDCVNVEFRRENNARVVANRQREAALDALEAGLLASGPQRMTHTQCSRTHFGGLDCTTW